MQSQSLTALAFDAYGTLFDVFSVAALCEELFPTRGTMLAQRWREKQLQYSLLRSLMERHRNFWQLTEDGLVYACKSLNLDLPLNHRQRLMEAYFTLNAFPDVRPGLEMLKKQGLRLAILSNGEPKMLQAATNHAGIRPAARRHHQCRRGRNLQTESPCLQPRLRTHVRCCAKHRFRLVKFVGHCRSRIGWAHDVLDSARRGRTT